MGCTLYCLPVFYLAKIRIMLVFLKGILCSLRINDYPQCMRFHYCHVNLYSAGNNKKGSKHVSGLHDNVHCIGLVFSIYYLVHIYNLGIPEERLRDVLMESCGIKSVLLKLATTHSHLPYYPMS